MTVFVKFITEPRKEFAVPSLEQASALLGSFEAQEVLIVKKWQKSDEVTVVLTAPYAWAVSNIFPSENPTSSNSLLSRARYFVFRDEQGEQLVYRLEDYRVVSRSGELARIEIMGGDARVHSETMTSAPNTSGEDWTGTASALLTRLFGRLSSAPLEGMAAWQRLPISALDSSAPTATEVAQGFVPLGSIEFGSTFTIGSPDPLPIASAIEELYGYLPDHEIAPVSRWGFDGTASPWDKWMVRQRVSRRAIFSENDGSLVINGSSGTNRQTETMSYSSKDYVRARYAAGINQGRTDLRGPWAGFATDSSSPPEGADVDKFLTGRARSATLRNKRITFDLTLSFSKLGIKPIIGMSTFARIGDLVYRINVDELASSYTAERGWKTTAPVFVGQDTVRVASIKDGPFIEFQVSSTTTTFSIPTCFTTASSFRWTVEVDGVFYGEYQGVSASTSAGIPLSLGTTGAHTIRIYDTTGEYNIGWARAFSFWSGTTGANNTTNRNKITRVLQDSDRGHLLSATDQGIYFRTNQFYSCLNLTSSYMESMPGSVETTGIQAYQNQYYGCTRLETASPESMGSGVTLVRNLYRSAQYYGCTALAEGPIEDCSEAAGLAIQNDFKYQQCYNSGVTRSQNEKMTAVSVGDGFRREQFASCSKLASAGREAFRSTAPFGYNFRSAQYQNCKALIVAAEEASMSGIGISFKSAQYSGCTALKAAAVERFTGTARVFRGSQYGGCTSLESPAAEVHVTITGNSDDRGSFRSNQYSGCTSIKKAAAEVAPTIIASSIHGYRSAMYQNCTALVEATPEEFEPITATMYLMSYRASQYSNTAITVAPDENINAPKAYIGGFRSSQYMNCINLVNPPATDGRHGGNLQQLGTTQAGAFRHRQFMGCISLVAPQEEYDFVVTTYSATSWNQLMTSQYEGCVSLRNDTPGGRQERYRLGSIDAAHIFRERQFAGCTSMVWPLLEPDIPLSMGVGNSGASTRNYQYQNCTAMRAVAPEQNITLGTIQPSTGRSWGLYRTGMYEGCSSLTGYTGNLLETSSRDGERPNYSAAFRSNQFRNTPATNVAGNRVKFKDGVEAIPGTNVPNNIY